MDIEKLGANAVADFSSGANGVAWTPKQVPIDQCPWYIDHMLTQALSDLRAKLPHLALDNLREALKAANRCKDMKRAGKIMYAMQCVKRV